MRVYKGFIGFDCRRKHSITDSCFPSLTSLHPNDAVPSTQCSNIESYQQWGEVDPRQVVWWIKRHLCRCGRPEEQLVLSLHCCHANECSLHTSNTVETNPTSSYCVVYWKVPCGKNKPPASGLQFFPPCSMFWGVLGLDLKHLPTLFAIIYKVFNRLQPWLGWFRRT